MAPKELRDIEERVMGIVSEKTGYPTDMLELDLDMEADLGIDTVKQVELFATIREEYHIAADEGITLSDYPTIRHVVGFIANGLGIEGAASLSAEGNVASGDRVGDGEYDEDEGSGRSVGDEISEEHAGDEGIPMAGSELVEAPAHGATGITRRGIEEWIISLISERTGYPSDMLEPDLDMEADLGIDTVKQVELMGAIRERYGLAEEGVNLSDYPTIASVVDYVATELGGVRDEDPVEPDLPESGTGDITDIFESAAEELEPEDVFREEPLSLPPAELSDYHAATFEPIAVVGMGCVFPDAPDIESFWKNIINKKNSIIDAPPDRWDQEVFYHPDPSIPNKTYAKIGGFVTDYEFDPLAFRIPPKMVERIDTVQLWGLTATKQAWADAGYDGKEIDPARVAVIMANAQGGEKRDEAAILIHLQQYQKALLDSGALDSLSEQERKRVLSEIEDRICGDMLSINEDSMPGELSNIIPARIANRFNFKGPNYTTDAACASSLAALDAAAKGLQARDFDVVITGGSDRTMNPVTYVKFCKIGVLSATGSRPFDAGADGFVMGEGAGVLVLKRLSDAMTDGDKIYAVLRGLGGSSDGRAKGITAPNPEGQTLAINAAYERAGYDPNTVSLVEAHGTSTVVGDAAELQTLTTIWGSATGEKTPVGIGSIKSQIGHLKSAAGIAGILKMVLAMHNRTLPPTINYREPNPKIDLSSSPFFVVTEPSPWERPTLEGREIPRRGGVSAFGFGGANFHATLEEYTGRYPVDPGFSGHVDRMAASLPFPVPEIITTVPAFPEDFDLDRYLSERAHAEGDVLFLVADSGDALKRLIGKVRNDLSLKGHRKDFRLADFVHKINLRSMGRRGEYRLSVAAGDVEELGSKLDLILDNIEDPHRMRALEVRGISSSDPETLRELLFEDSGEPRIGFIFPGQGSQYLNMLRDLSQKYRIVAETFEESDRIMTGIIGCPLTDIIFADEDEPDESKKKKLGQLRRTEITQPAMITGDIALYRLLAQFGVEPDAVAGHSLGEYGALVASGVMDFESALLAASARGREMANIQIDDKGKMASIAASEDIVQKVLDEVDGYAIVANKNSPVESVISGESRAVEIAVEKLGREGINCIMLPVSHAFHSDIVAPAKEPLRKFLSNIPIKAPAIPTLTNVHGGLYPTGPGARDEIIDILVEQVAGAVEWRREMEFMYGDLGIRIFLEVGTKRALTITVKNIFQERSHRAVLTNHPKKGGIHTFNEALGALAVFGIPVKWHSPDDSYLYTAEFIAAGAAMRGESAVHAVHTSRPAPTQPLSVSPDLAEYVDLGRRAKLMNLYLDRVVITGTGLGLPGKSKAVFDSKNADMILDGINLIDAIDPEYRKKFLDKNIVKLVKASNGQAHFERIEEDSDVLKLAGQMGRFDLHGEYGIEEELVSVLDISTQLAIAGGLEAMRDAGIPLVRKYNMTSTGNFLRGNWELPEEMQEDTAVIFSSTFPGYDKLLELTSNYYMDKYGPRAKRELMNLYASIITRISDDGVKREMTDWFAETYTDISADVDETDVYEFNRKFMLAVLSMGHAQFAQLINARGPNLHNNAACATSTQAVGMAEDLLRMGRCRRVILISGDVPTYKHNMEWLVTALLANGAATTEGNVEEAALPFDRRRKGLIVGMGGIGIVFERAEDVAARGMDPIVELMATYMANSAFHATRLDTAHVASEMNHFLGRFERRYGFSRKKLVDDMVFVSHETYTPARGGSSNAEKDALEATFGQDYRRILITNTKGFTGHAFGCGIEDVIAIKILQKGKVPPIANYRVPDPYLEGLNLSGGVRKFFTYALRFAAGFGSQMAMSIIKIINRDEDRVVDQVRYREWLKAVSKQMKGELVVEDKILKIKDDGSRPSYTGPDVRAEKREEPIITPAVERLALPAHAESDVSSEVALPEATGTGGLERNIIDIIAEKTGYPADMLELDLDMEADLGIDTVKQVELFAAIREKYGLERDEGVNLSDYSTIGSVVDYIRGSLPEDMKTSAPGSSVPGPSTPIPSSSPATPPGARTDGLEGIVIDIIAEKTGYPADMLELDLDMEADLGIDTVKQVELFAAIREKYGLERDEGVNLSDYSTIGSVVGYIRGRITGEGSREVVSTTPSGPAPDITASEPVTTPPAEQDQGVSPRGELETVIIDIIAEKTGYPADMLEPDLDMEADLGIDTVKQVELFAAIREKYSLERDEGVNLSEYSTIGSVVDYIASRLPSEGTGGDAVEIPVESGGEEMPVATTGEAELTGEARDLRRYLTRYVPAPLSDAIVTNLKGKTVIVAADDRGISRKLGALLRKKGARVVEYDYRYDDDDKQKGSVRARKDTFSFDLFDSDAQREVLDRVHDKYGEVSGVFYLIGLDEEPHMSELDFDGWVALNRRKVKSLFGLAKALNSDLTGSDGDAFFLSAVEMGGSFGIEGDGTFTTPVQGGITGLTKALGKEMEKVRVKCVDIGELSSAAKVARLLLDEVEKGDTRLEVCYGDGGRRIAQMYHGEIDPLRKPNLDIDSEWVFVIPGGGFGITAEVAKDLARHFRPRLVLLDIVEMPDNAEELADLDERGMEDLKNGLYAELRERGERVTPVLLEKEYRRYTMPRAIMRNIREMRDLGATVQFHTCDVTDHQRVREVMNDVRESFGRIDGIIHAAGLEISKLITQKPPEQFSLVFDVKVNGAYNLFETTRQDDVKAYVTFSSVAGRFGNIGQTDYSSANDLLNKYVGLLQRQGGDDVSAISTNWTGWRGVGMATRGSLLKIFDDAGVTLIPLDYGRKKVREEILFSGSETEVTIAGKVAFLDADGIILPDGLSPEAWMLGRTLAEKRDEFPLLDEVLSYVPCRKLVVGKHLDAGADLYLEDHSIAGTPYLPGVMGVEVFAEAARLMFPDLAVRGMEDVAFTKPVKLLRSRPLDLRIVCEVLDNGGGKALLDARVESDFINPKGVKMGDTRIHFTGRIQMGKKRLRAKKSKGVKIPKKVKVGFDDIYQRFFHGPTFRVLDGILDIGDVPEEGTICWGRFRKPEGRFFEFTEGHEFASSPMLRECAFQTCGMFTLFHDADMSLPDRIGKIEMRNVTGSSKAFYTRVVYRGEAEDGPMKFSRYDVDILDEKGNVVDTMSDYRMIVTEKLEEDKRFK